jgi:hypothetical protein
MRLALRVAVVAALSATWLGQAVAADGPHEDPTEERACVVLGRVHYDGQPGGHVVGQPSLAPSQDAIALIEQRGERYELVVAFRGAEPARWPVSKDSARYGIFWVGAHSLVLGPSALRPRIRVTWAIEQAD